MKTIYLHIGTPKTGTTAIQNFCNDNQNILNRNGYCYPEFPYQYTNVGRLRNAHFLFGRIFNQDKTRNYLREEEIFREGFEQIYKTFESYNNIILSDEGLWNCGFREDNNAWEKIKKELDKGQFEIKVIVYLRLQDAFLYSWWNQRIKEGLRRESQLTWERMTEELPVVQLDYYDMLERISAYIGRDNIIVRRFEKDRFAGGTLYTDFVDAVGLEYTKEYRVINERRNISLTQNNNEIKRILNTLPDLDTDGNAMFKRILVRQSGYRGENNEYSMFSKEELNAFLAEYRDGNAKIAREYLGEEELFSLSCKDKKKWNPDDGYMLEDVILFVGSLALEMEKELKEQKRQINGIRNMLKHPIGSIGRKIKALGR